MYFEHIINTFKETLAFLEDANLFLKCYLCCQWHCKFVQSFAKITLIPYKMCIPVNSTGSLRKYFKMWKELYSCSQRISKTFLLHVRRLSGCGGHSSMCPEMRVPASFIVPKKKTAGSVVTMRNGQVNYVHTVTFYKAINSDSSLRISKTSLLWFNSFRKKGAVGEDQKGNINQSNQIR